MRWPWVVAYALAGAGIGLLWRVLLVRLEVVSTDSYFTGAALFAATGMFLGLAARRPVTLGQAGLFLTGILYPWVGLLLFSVLAGAATSQAPTDIWDNCMSLAFWGFVALCDEWLVVVAGGLASALLLLPMALRSLSPEPSGSGPALAPERAGLA